MELAFLYQFFLMACFSKVYSGFCPGNNRILSFFILFIFRMISFWNVEFLNELLPLMNRIRIMRFLQLTKIIIRRKLKEKNGHGYQLNWSEQEIFFLKQLKACLIRINENSIVKITHKITLWNKTRIKGTKNTFNWDRISNLWVIEGILWYILALSYK